MVNANIPLTPNNPSNMHPSTPYDNMHTFLSLIDNDSLIQILLLCDRNFQVLDKWLVAIVYQYLLQARVLSHKCNRENFFLALYLAIEFEEDEDRKVKDVLLDYLLHHDNNCSSKKQFVKKKDKFWKKLGFRCMVPRERLKEIISINRYHEVWRRERKAALSGANRSFSCKIDPPPVNYKLQWPIQHHNIVQQQQQPRTATPEVPIVIDLTQDSPTAPAPPPPAHVAVRPDRKKKSAAYRHLHSIVTLIEHDRGRRRPPPDILKMKHAQQKRLSELQMLESLARSNSFTALGSELAHLSMNTSLHSLSNLSVLNSLSNYSHNTAYNNINQLLYNSDTDHFAGLPGLVLLPDRRMSFPLFNMEIGSAGSAASPAMPMVVPVVPRTDHWV